MREPQQSRAGDKVTIGPQVGELATWTLPSGGGGGICNAPQRGPKSEVAQT